MINFSKLEEVNEAINLKILSCEEIDEDSHYFYIIEFEYSDDFDGVVYNFINSVKLPITENINKAILRKINNIKKEYYEDISK